MQYQSQNANLEVEDDTIEFNLKSFGNRSIFKKGQTNNYL